MLFTSFYILPTTLETETKTIFTENGPNAQDVSLLYYEDWEGFWWIAEGNDEIDWSFSGSNTFVGVDVFAVDYDNYYNFYNGYSYTYYSLSNGGYYADSGTFTVPYSDDWYIIWANWDSDIQSTSLTYTGYCNYNYFGGTRINYGGWGYSYFLDPLETGDEVDWEFQGSNTYVGITAMAMDDDEYWYFENGYSYTYYPLSSGLYWNDYGTFTIPYSDDWYIVFLNEDGDMVPTDLIWDVTHYALGGTIEITTPDSYDTWDAGSSYYIYYDYSNVDYVDIYLYEDGDYYSTIATEQTATGSYYWTLPSDLPSSSSYQIYIEDYYDSVNDWSELFTIDNPNMLDNGYYVYQYLSASGGDDIDWSFSGSNTYVGITVYALDSDEYLNFEYGYSYEPWILSDGSYYSDYGTFYVPYSDNWFFCFINWDPDMESTILDTNLDLIENNFGGVRIDNNEYVYYSFPSELTPGTVIDWDFTGTNVDVGIMAMALSSEDFSYYYNGQGFALEMLSSGFEYNDSGSFTVPDQDHWYFVFENWEMYSLPTDIVFNIEIGSIPVPPDDDEYEDNDDFYSAVEISAGSYENLVLLDEDWFKIYLEVGEVITVELFFSHSMGDIDLGLYSASYVILAGSASTNDNEYLTYEATETEFHYIRVDDYQTNPSYNLSVQITPVEYPDDIYEENDVFTDATWVSDGFYSDLCAYDDDWYIIHLEAGDTISIYLDFIHADGDIDVVLLNQAADILAISESTNDDEYFDFNVTETDDYFILVYSFSPNGDYSLEISIIQESPTDDEPTDDEPTDDEPTDDEPTDDEPTDDEPTDDEPTDDGSGDGFEIPGFSAWFLVGAICLGIGILTHRYKNRR